MRKITVKEIFSILSYRGYLRWIPSPTFLKMKYRLHTGKKLNLDTPKTFNEKLQWLKLYNAEHFNPLYTKLADKVEAKKIVAELIGEEHIIPTLGVWDHFDDIDFDALPNQFVLKTNHDSGGIVIVKDKSRLDKVAAKKKLEKSKKNNFYWFGREPQYRDIVPKIFAEKFIDDGGNGLSDYKFHNFNGIPQVILVCRERFGTSGLTDDFFSADWEHLEVKRPRHPNAQQPILKPESLDKMLELSRKLAKDFIFVRTDFYTVGAKVYFGEMTFFPASGFSPFEPDIWDEKLGKLLRLPCE